VSRRSIKQTSLTFSSREAELIATYEVTKSVIWRQLFLKDVRTPVLGATPVALHPRYQPPGGALDNMPLGPPVVVHNDNQGQSRLPQLTITPDSQTCGPHVSLHQEQDSFTSVTLEYMPTDMRADILTKLLSKIKNAREVQLLGMHTHPAACGRLLDSLIPTGLQSAGSCIAFSPRSGKQLYSRVNRALVAWRDVPH
jgi:hypothetical protein